MTGKLRGAAGALLILLGVGLIAGSWALHSWGTTNAPTQSGQAPKLNGAEQRALQHDRSAVATLPAALKEVPLAMVDAAHSAAGSTLSRTQASELLFEHPELGQLLRAIEHPKATASPLLDGLSVPPSSSRPVALLSMSSLIVFFVLPGVLAVGLGLLLRIRRGQGRRRPAGAALCFLAGVVVLVGVLAPLTDDRSVWSAGSPPQNAHGATVSGPAVQADLNSLEQVYDDVVPALQTAGAAGHQVLDPSAAIAGLSADPHLRALNKFVTNFNELYGVGVLISQEAAATSTDSVVPHAMRGLAYLGVIGGGLLVLGGLVSGIGGSRRRQTPADPDTNNDPSPISAFSETPA